MAEHNRTYRLRTRVGVNASSPVSEKYLTAKLTSTIDTIEIMSMKINQENAYKFHSADYGVIVGRAIANGGFGVPNVKVSIFIPASEATKNDAIYNEIYPYKNVTSKNSDKIRYNLLPDAGDDDCYQAVGTFPNKRLVLDDDNYMEIYDTYYKFTTRTNAAGDYMIFGVPTGGQSIHFDVDLSDVGVLSQRPRDMVYKGYNINQFENANQFKVDNNLANLPQIISQDDSVYVYPFWGEEDENVIGVTRHDFDINYKFEPTCVFMGSIISDTNSNHISKKCLPTVSMGMMDEMITGSGTIEMIRKKLDGSVEQFNIQGTQLINDNGVWCYQIPMNLDYAMTDEYGNLVPSDDPTKGIPTRASVRFRFSMQDFENDSLNSFRTKVLVPNNPEKDGDVPDYVFGSFTSEDSFRDLLWNNVYTVKSFIPRFQKGNGNSNRRFSGIKQCNYYGQNNPVPYNNMRINLSFQFKITCLIVKMLIWLTSVYNMMITLLSNLFSKFPNLPVIKQIKNIHKQIGRWKGFIAKVLRVIIRFILWPFTVVGAIAVLFENLAKSMSCIYLDGSMCDSLEGAWYFAPGCGNKKKIDKSPYNHVWTNMMAKIEGKKTDSNDYSSQGKKDGGGLYDNNSIDSTNADDMRDEENAVVIEYENPEGSETGTTAGYIISRGIDYFLQCIEISLAQEFRVIQFDFYNDWINGMIYIPRWERSLKRKRKFFIFGKSRVEIRACNDSYTKRFFERKNYLTEQCGVSHKAKPSDNSVATPVGCKNNKKYKCHKKQGRRQFRIFHDGGAVHSEATASGLYAYYFRPCEYVTTTNRKVKRINLFATDIVLLGSLSECNINGVPAFSDELTSTTYQLPGPLATVDTDEEGKGYTASSRENSILRAEPFVGVFDIDDSVLSPKNDGSVTEEAGIDWSVTGPGQGTEKKKRTYTPGGHFLGITCVNAESSIKSCVNLKRICEASVSMSVRKEIFNGYKEAGNANSGMYVDIIPNGLISKDEIYDGSFRRMFATMNSNGLKTRVNPSGFTVYDFTYMSPENFGGEMKRYTSGDYNSPNPVENMSGYLAKNGDINIYGEKWEETDDEGAKYGIKPIRRALEETDYDYMRFRLGLDKLTNANIQGKFLGYDDYGYYMPVYDNSFYFYFGLKPGATAIEEFHKQFYAECKPVMNTTDNRLKATLEYTVYGKKVEAFTDDVELSMFENILAGNTAKLRIFTSSAPVRVIVDGDQEKSTTIGNADAGKTYIEILGSDLPDLFTLELGRHTFTIMDSDGRIGVKTVNVVRENVSLCPEIIPVPFSDSDYVINSTASLINGSAVGRGSLGGEFSFDWTEAECGSDTLIIHGPEDERITRNNAGLTILFAGRSHLIKVGNWPGDISAYPGFEKYNGKIFNGMWDGDAIYAGESAIYDMYILYREGGRETPEPILVEDNIEIGEPPTIDFDVFRDILESEEESPVTYRNPVIKPWSRDPQNWYTTLYSSGELTFEQIWYIKKTMFYIYEKFMNPENEVDESFLSKRELYVNTFYPTEVGNVTVFIKKNNEPETEGNIIGAGGGVSYNDKYAIRMTGRTEDGQVIAVPKTGTFYFPIIYKPFYYRAVIWEGYTVFTEADTSVSAYRSGHLRGDIFNGIAYDSSTSKCEFGTTLFNERYNITDEVNTRTTFMGDREMTSTRVTEISYDVKDSSENPTYIDDTTMALLVTEGAPKSYDSSYQPAEYRISVPGVGMPSNWVLNLNMNFNGSVPVGRPVITVMDTMNEPSPSESLYYFTMTRVNPGLYDDYDYTQSRGAASTAQTEDGVFWQFSFNYIRNTTRTIVGEYMALDQVDFNGTDKNLGFLKTRNIIRNNLDFDFSTKITSSEFNVKITLGVYSGEIVVMNVGVYFFFNDAKLISDMAATIEDIIIKFNGEDKEYRLVSELGYSTDCITGKGVKMVVNEAPDDDEEDYYPQTDEFTDRITSGLSPGQTIVVTFTGVTVTVITNGLGGNGKDDDGVSYNNTIDLTTLTYNNARILASSLFKVENSEGEEG